MCIGTHRIAESKYAGKSSAECDKNPEHRLVPVFFLAAFRPVGQGPVAEAVRIARRTRAIALQSIVVGLALSGVAMAAAAMGQIAPVAGALLQEGIDVAVILNALRALGDGGLGRA
jgi:hypothetical protein